MRRRFPVSILALLAMTVLAWKSFSETDPPDVPPCPGFLDIPVAQPLDVWAADQPAWEPAAASLHDLGKTTKGKLGSWECWTLVGDPRWRRDDPLAGGWRTDDSWKMDVAGRLFVFGKLEGSSEGLGGAEMNLSGKTGLGWKAPPLLGAELQFRGGPALTYSDPLRSERGQERSELFVELLAKYPLPLPGNVGLEYQGAAVPALGPLTSPRINQDLRLAIPVGDSGVLKLGAKHSWEDAGTTRDWRDGMQVYLGLEVKPGVGRK